MADASAAISEIDAALAPFASAPPPSSAAGDDDGSPGVRFATPRVSPAQAAVDEIDAALANHSSSSSVAPAVTPATPAPPPFAKPKWSDIPSDVVNQLGAGINRGAMSMLGLPGDVQKSWNSIWDRAVLGATHKAMDWTGYGPQAGTPERAEFDRGWGALNDAGNVVVGPQNLPTGQQFTRALEAVGGKLPEPRTVPGEYAHTVGEFVPGGGRGVFTAALLPGLASEAAGQITKGTGLEPYARIAGGITGATVGGAVPAIVKPIASYVRPMTSAGQEAIAARTLGQETADIPAARAALDEPHEIVPGSTPTTFQQTGDVGLGQLERKQRMNAETAPAYIERDRAQNAARMDALQGVQSTGSPADVAARFSQLRDDLDHHAQARIDELVPAAQDANLAMGGRGTADSTGYALRQPMADARAAAKQQEDALWAAVDPDGTLAAPMGSIKDASAQIYGSLPRASEANLAAGEKTFRDLAASYQPVEPFAELQGLRSELAGAMRQELAQSGRTPAYQRMSGLMDAVQRTINGTVEHRAAQEAHAVATGAMDAADTIEARVAALRSRWNIDADAARANTSRSLGRTGTDAFGLAGSGAAGDFGAVRTGGSSARGVGQASSDPRVPQEASFQPNFDAAAASRLRTASDATKQRAQTFDEGLAGDVLAPGGRSGQYRMPDAAVPAAVVPSGKPTDALAVRQFLAAGGTPQALSDATAYSVRSTAMRPDGTLDPIKVRSWINRNGEALSEMPPEVASRFRNVADAQASVDGMVAQRERDLAAFQKTAVARVANLQHGEDVVKTIGGIFGAKDAVGQMKVLASAAAADPAAKDGLRRAIVEHLLGVLTSNASVNASGISQIRGDAYLGFMKKNGAVLRQVFEPNELDHMATIGRDIDRALRTHQTKGLTSSPGTAQDLGAAKGSILGELSKEIGPAGLAMASHAAGANVVMSGLGWLGAKTVGRMRAAGLANANDLVTKAMLDPALAKRLLAKVPTTPDLGTAQALGDQFVRLARSTALGINAGSSERRPRQ